MAYRTRTYIAGDWDHDKNAVDTLYYWKNNRYLNFDFLDASMFTVCVRVTLPEYGITKKIMNLLSGK